MDRTIQPRSRRSSLSRPSPSLSSASASPSPSPSSADFHHRSPPIVRSASAFLLPPKPPSVSRLSPLLPSLSVNVFPASPPAINHPNGMMHEKIPSVFGLPLKYVSLVTLAVQNAALSIVMHYSRVYVPPSQSYSPASAVLLNELLKGSISFMIALLKAKDMAEASSTRKAFVGSIWSHSFQQVYSEIFSPDCWKLSIPALLYVVQNSLQFVAVSNLPVASFQVSYQMKILTTAAFSVVLLRKRLGSTKWLSLFFLAIGVAIVQLSTFAPASAVPKDIAVGSAHESAPHHMHEMSPPKGFAAVAAACLTSGLAGVYFEMVLKNSKADLWVRNVQLSLFSLIPAFIPIVFSSSSSNSSRSLFNLFLFFDVFRNFGVWAWATVAIQVFGGLVTAVVIKYSDNILKGFATSLSIILSFLASIVLFNFRITPSFTIGVSMVLVATWMYNQPSRPDNHGSYPVNGAFMSNDPRSGKKSSDSVILGQFSRKKSSPYNSPREIVSAMGFGGGDTTENSGSGSSSATVGSQRYLESPYGSPFPSRTPSPSVQFFNGDARRGS